MALAKLISTRADVFVCEKCGAQFPKITEMLDCLRQHQLDWQEEYRQKRRHHCVDCGSERPFKRVKHKGKLFGKCVECGFSHNGVYPKTVFEERS